MPTAGGAAEGAANERLTADEVALVLRRATELDTVSSGPGALEGFDPAAVEEAAGEVGLSPLAVRQALAELRIGALQPVVAARTRLADPATVVQSRIVSTRPDQIRLSADDFFRQRCFECRRRQPQRAIYRQRRDVLSRARRVVNLDAAAQLAGVDTVTVTMSPLAPGSATNAATMVRLEASLHPVRRGAVTTATGYGVVALTGTAALATGEPGALIVGGPIGFAIGASGVGRRRRWRRRREEEVSEVLAALLDGLP